MLPACPGQELRTFMRWMNKIDDFLAVIEKFLVVVFFSALILLIFFNIISRNLFHLSFQKILEIAPALVLWLVLVGSSLALKEKRHIKLELLLRFCSEKIRFSANIAASLFGMIITGILFIAALEFVTNEIAIFGWWGWISVIFPIFFLVSFFRYFVRMVYHMGRPVSIHSRSLSASKPDKATQQ